jgi:transcriptional regulator of arginine metabolism
MASKQSQRIDAIRELLEEGKPSTQEGIGDYLKRQQLRTTQSTISRDLRRLGAIRTTNPFGETVYSLPLDTDAPPAAPLDALVTGIHCNDQLIVIHTAVGSASLIAREIDKAQDPEILGTLAGDDTIFIAPARTGRASVQKLLKKIRQTFF